VVQEAKDHAATEKNVLDRSTSSSAGRKMQKNPMANCAGKI
jgi:hypothetical protein